MYYKAIKSNLTFNEAIDSFKKGHIIRLGNSLFNPKDIHVNDIRFSIGQITSNSWEVVCIDYDMIDKLDDVRDMMNNINLYIDSRFHKEERMDIFDYWQLFENQFVTCDENLQYEFMKFYVNKYKK